MPYAMPYSLGISASAQALIGFIGVWKVFDVLAATRPEAVVATAVPFAVYLVSPVEYKTHGRDRAAAIRAAAPARRHGAVLRQPRDRRVDEQPPLHRGLAPRRACCQGPAAALQ